jgi:hypothetical protein
MVAEGGLRRRSGTANASLQLKSIGVASGWLPTRADGNSLAQGGVASGALYAAPANNNYQLISNGPLQLADASYAGALLPDGSWNTA